MKEKKKFNLGNYHRLIGTFLALLLVAALATSLGVAANMKENYELELDNNYKKAYHEAMDSLSDVELKLSKVSVSEGVTTQQTLLSEIWMNSEIAENNIAQLSGRDGNTETIIRFLNQLGDYCHYLSEKLTDQPLDEQEKEKLDSLYGIVRSLQDSFKSAEEGIMQNATLVGRMDEGIMLLGDCYEHFNNDSNIEYPEMIYDGPFSDALAIRNAQYLNSLIA
ncbi:MAG: germination protein YpeB, partial [Clostridia bacterium]|nr:germination protein YpeB [Clostridia bacterium]